MPKLHREIILGPPGTGKTTELIQRLQQAFDEGIEPEEVAYLAFTKKAADVAIRRSMEHFGFERGRFPYFRTIHSLAYHENKIDSKSVMRAENYKELGAINGWDFTASYEDYEERPNYGKGLGDNLLRCYDLAMARGISPREEAISGDYPFSAFAIDTFVQQFEAYKRRYNLVTFNDFLMTRVDLDVRLVIIDEAQDLTHLQWDFVRKSFNRVETVLIAGDDDQCIYQWSGADLSFFLKIDAKITNLKQSHRCDAEIWKMANQISRRIGRRYPKDWKPVRDGGLLHVRKDPFSIDMSQGEWMVLVRKNRHLRRYYQVCMAAGRIFHDGNCWINETKWFRAVLAYNRLRAGELVNSFEVKLIAQASSHVKRNRDLGEYTWEDLDWNFETRPEWQVALDQLDLQYRYFIERCIANGEDITQPGNIRLSTIHAAKGGEADNVMLDMRLDGIPLAQFRKDPDSERRVWYVAVSRARHQLVLTGAVRNEAVDL